MVYKGWRSKGYEKWEYAAHSDGVRINNSGSPYNITASTGAVVYNNNALGQIWVNSSKSPDEKGAFWRYYNTGLGGAYNRQIQQLDNGNLFITARNGMTVGSNVSLWITHWTPKKPVRWKVR